MPLISTNFIPFQLDGVELEPEAVVASVQVFIRDKPGVSYELQQNGVKVILPSQYALDGACVLQLENLKKALVKSVLP